MKKTTWIIFLLGLVLLLAIFYISSDTSSIGLIDLQYNQSNYSETADNFSSNSEPHFTHMPLTYSVDIPSNLYYNDDTYGNVALVGQKNKIIDISLAFKLIEESTNHSVSFIQVNKSDYADIRVVGIFPAKMNDILKSEGDNESGDGVLGLTHLENKSNLLLNATIYFQPNQVYTDESFWSYGRCTLANGTVFPHLEIHEILHALGMGHNFDKIDDVMFPVKSRSRCKTWQIDPQYTDCLRKIYSNSSIKGDCSPNNMFPPKYNASELEVEDFTWERFPITYSIQDCALFKFRKIKRAVNDFQTIFNRSNLFIYSDDLNSSQIIFSCNSTVYEERYQPLTTDYWEDYQIALKTNYDFSDGLVKKATISIFYSPNCDSLDATPSSLELLAIYRAIGLRKQYGLDTEQAGCSSSYASLAISGPTIKRIKEMYPKYF